MYAVDLRGAFDLLRMQRLTQRVWHPEARWHVGDLAWERRFHSLPTPEWPTRIWMEGDNLPIAWGWLTLPDLLDLVVDPAHDASLAQEVVDWAIGVAGRDATLKATVTTGERSLHDVLSRNRFVATEGFGQRYLACVPTEVTQPDAPPGFSVRSVMPKPEELEARVGVHVAAWDSKTMTTDVYRRVQHSWPYRYDLDIVAEHLQGDDVGSPVFASSCLAWFDDVNRVGELEPVGTDPRFRRRGLAAATCGEAVRRLGVAGAERAIVYASGDPDRPAPLALYESLGFEEITRTLELQRN
ncbi:MAG TPA: GNAT family N-acetyltransferase [Acidimicrobiales bacterium]|nr:GNAT family N-acetyltransferase [Acidimicrobiales bacterium]